MNRINTDLCGSDKEDLLCLVRYMQDQERSILWIVRCITILIIIRKQLMKPFRQATVEDLRSCMHWIDNKGYKASSNEKFRKVLKFFFKVVYGNNKYYPEQVEWIYTRVSKEKAGKQMSMDMAEYLEEEEGLIDGLNRVVISRRRYSPPVIGLEGGMAI